LGVEYLKKLGKLYGIAKSGVIVVESVVKNPENLIGAIVYDKDMVKVGVVTDVIGRVDHPYIIVKPDTKDLLSGLEKGSTLYYILQRKKAASSKVKQKKRGRGENRGSHGHEHKV